MTISQAITPHLPYLRRFARALCGSQSAGDSYAMASLEAILADPASFDGTLEPRIALYRVFLHIWHSVALNAHDTSQNPVSEPFASAQAAAGLLKVEALTPRARVAFLLSAVEGFTPLQIAGAMHCSLGEASGMLAEASTELAARISTNVLIIEDEPMIALDIEGLVEGLGHRVIEIARTHKEAVAAVSRERPGLILADIQRADGSSGIEAVTEILGAFDVPVIFITAYPERLLTGERPEPAFLITKPFRTDMVRAMISQALFFEQKASAPLRKAYEAG